VVGAGCRPMTGPALTAARYLRVVGRYGTLSAGYPVFAGLCPCFVPYAGDASKQKEEAHLDDYLRPRAIDASAFALEMPLGFGGMVRPLLLVALLGGLIGCASEVKLAPSIPTHPVAIAPAPADAPPVPRRKPPLPNPQPPTAAGSDVVAAVSEPPTPEETAPATLDPAPSTPEAPSDLVGMDSGMIEHSLGPPESRRDVPPAVVWHYANDACGLDVWLYRDLQSGALRALFTEVKGDDRTDQRRQYCIEQLALQPAGGSRSVGADAASTR